MEWWCLLLLCGPGLALAWPWVARGRPDVPLVLPDMYSSGFEWEPKMLWAAVTACPCHLRVSQQASYSHTLLRHTITSKGFDLNVHKSF